jgi:hypothetical protein
MRLIFGLAFFLGLLACGCQPSDVTTDQTKVTPATSAMSGKTQMGRTTPTVN